MSFSAGRAAMAAPAVFTLTILVSAFLLFSVQPMFTKMALPLLGGSPNVWTTAMLFFQMALLTGYAYAHGISRFFSLRHQIILHLGVTGLAALVLPIGIGSGWTAPTEGFVAWWLLWLFAASVGLPFFALAANAPLLQKWFARTNRKDAEDPFYLYAASNLGSFGALLAYPFLIEPFFGVTHQSWLWAVGYGVLAACIATAGCLAVRGNRLSPAGETVSPQPVQARGQPIAMKTLAVWAGLAFVPSSLMLGVTTTIATDLGSFPLVWVVPLALYLLTFVLSFARRQIAPDLFTRKAHILFLSVTVFFVASHMLAPTSMVGIILLLVAFFFIAWGFHRELAKKRPPERHLTIYYLTLAAGGALGGIFNSIIAPLAFNAVYEFPLALALAGLAYGGVVHWRRDCMTAALFLAFGVFCITFLADQLTALSNSIAFVAKMLPFLIGTILLIRDQARPARLTMTVLVMFGLSALVAGELRDTVTKRSFFGVLKIKEDKKLGVRWLQHGTTLHGAQRTDEVPPTPLINHYPGGPFGQLFKTVKVRNSAQIGIVGLGSGALSCYRTPAQKWTYFEIDPLVEEVARDRRFFTFLRDCTPQAPVIIGDARIALADQPDGRFDVLVLDAFNSDSIPVHLLTREALALARRKLAPDGIVIIHISNRYFDLEAPVAATARAVGFEVLVQRHYPDAETRKTTLGQASWVLLLSADKEFLKKLRQDSRWSDAGRANVPIWTDDFSNLLPYVKFN